MVATWLVDQSTSEQIGGENSMMHFDDVRELLDINNIPYRVEKMYGEDNEPYNSIWLNKGHFEFSANNILDNVVAYQSTSRKMYIDNLRKRGF